MVQGRRFGNPRREPPRIGFGRQRALLVKFTQMATTTFNGTIQQIDEVTIDDRHVIGMAIIASPETKVRFTWHSSVRNESYGVGTRVDIGYVPTKLHFPNRPEIVLPSSDQVRRQSHGYIVTHEQIRTGLPGAEEIGLDRDIITFDCYTDRETCLFDGQFDANLAIGEPVAMDLKLVSFSLSKDQATRDYAPQTPHVLGKRTVREPIGGRAAIKAVHEKRNQVADKYKAEFLDLSEQARLIEETSHLSLFQFVKGSDLTRFERLPTYHQVKHLLHPYDQASGAKHFVSHRWLHLDHPDRDGAELRLLREHVQHDEFYWIDFTCLPQGDRTEQEQLLFQDSIAWLPSLIFHVNVIALRFREDDYFGRAWCFFEFLAANVLSNNVQAISEDRLQNTTADPDERAGLEETLLTGTLPNGLRVSNQDDLDPLRRACSAVATYFKLRIIEHYLGLGQQLSNQRLFFGEDPYYYLASCDFHGIFRWLFEKLREHGIALDSCCREENIFELMAEKEEFCHETNPYSFSKNVFQSEGQVGWLVIHKHVATSANNLFYILSSLVK